jgi:integrase
MSRVPKRARARRGEIGLVRLRSGYWAIRWGRKLASQAGITTHESTQTRDRAEAERILLQRRLEVFRALGDDGSVRAAMRQVRPTSLSALISDFLRAYKAGELVGRKPAPGTVGLCLHHLLGVRGGLQGFADNMGRSMSSDLDSVLVTRWLEGESRRLAPDSIRMKLVVARRVVDFAAARGYVTEDTAKAVRTLRPPPSAKGRVRVDGVPSELEIRRVLQAMKPRYTGKVRPRAHAKKAYRPVPYHRIAELQLRLGIRRGEVLAIEESWLDEPAGRVRVLVSDDFDTKSHASREVDGVDPTTFALAHEVLALKRTHRATVSGYKEAWKRACARLERAGQAWAFRSKSHSLRAAYASLSRMAGVPLTVVRDRLGHASERVTERYYLGRTNEPIPGPFAGSLLMADGPVEATARVIPLRPTKMG